MRKVGFFPKNQAKKGRKISLKSLDLTGGSTFFKRSLTLVLIFLQAFIKIIINDTYHKVYSYKFIVCLLIPFLWFFSVGETGASTLHSISNSNLDETILNDGHSIRKEGGCAVTADGHLECDELSAGDQNSEESSHLYQRVVEYFLDTVWTNASCDCGTNDGCTRGCLLESNVGRGYHPLPIRKCNGRKSPHRSNNYCAKHVTGALMAVAHEFLLNHCRNAEQKIHSYEECLSNIHEDIINSNINICRYGFKFPSAICMLNLDGQSFSLYDQISSPRIRSKCKKWDPYNQLLLSVYVPLYDGTFMIIPLFKKIPPEKNKEFKENPDKIPTGSIIVTDSYNINGHVEVKTNRINCGKSKNLTCFCSDYCRERLKYHHPILVVFEWNPKFIKYVSRNYPHYH